MKDVKRWAGWPKTPCLRALGVSGGAYYRRRRAFAQGAPPAQAGPGASARPPAPHAVLPEEREAAVRYALEHPSPRHRELAWKMVDDDVVYLSPSSVYRILRAEDLVPRWPPKRQKRRRHEDEEPQRPDEAWQSDIRYVKVDGHKYYLVIFIDEYSRYIVHHELMCQMDKDTLSLEAQRAIERLRPGRTPRVQTDNGSGYISDEFKKVLSENGLSHVRIKPHCPEENGIVERAHRTLAEALDEAELKGLYHAREVIADVIQRYNHERLHSALHFLRPVDYYRGDPKPLLEQRRRKLAEARHRRRERNLAIQQQTFPFEAASREVGHNLIPEPICVT